MSNLYSTKQKIAIANDIIEKALNNKITLNHDNHIERLHKIEKKYQKNKSYDLSDFAISLTELPEKHFKLMLAIGWLNIETEKPRNDLDGFYCDVYGSDHGITQMEHYITVDAYIDLLFIELQIIEMYGNIKTG